MHSASRQSPMMVSATSWACWSSLMADFNLAWGMVAATLMGSPYKWAVTRATGGMARVWRGTRSKNSRDTARGPWEGEATPILSARPQLLFSLYRKARTSRERWERLAKEG